MAEPSVTETAPPPGGAIAAFADGLRRLTALLAPHAGWYAVFTEGDPDGMRDCLEGREVPPWDVVASLLHDAAARHGPRTAADAQRELAERYGPAVRAYDQLSGGEGALRGRLDTARRERDAAASRVHGLPASDAADPPGGADRISAADLAWARDYHARTASRCAELESRLRDFAPGPRGAGEAVRSDDGARLRGGYVLEDIPYTPQQGVWEPESADDEVAGSAGLSGGEFAGAQDGERAGAGPSRQAVEEAAPVDPRPSGKKAWAAKRRARGGGSRFAGAADVDEGPSLVPPGMDIPAAGPGRGGARFAGAVERVEPEHHDPGPGELAAARERARDTARRLAALHDEDRGGEAHVLLCAAAAGPALELAALVAELEHTGSAADGATLLWEAASLPPDALAAAADSLAATGRDADCEQLLRQGAARPVEQTAATALALYASGRFTEVTLLLAALVRSRTPVEVARSAHAGPEVLVPALLTASGEVSDHHYRSLANALRGTGLPGVPEAN